MNGSLISNRLKEIMFRKNLKLSELADITDVPLETLRGIYYSKSINPQITTLYKICKGLNISLDDFIGFEKVSTDELEMLKNYQNCSVHGKNFLLTISRFEANYSTYLKENFSIKHTINCLVPNGNELDGFEYTTCDIEQVETIYNEAYMAIKITTDIYTPLFLRGDIITLANRYPRFGEKAVYLKNGRIYFREYYYDSKKIILKTLTKIGNDIVSKNMREFQVLGTYINIIR